jgi:DNA-binding transcriptional ArsR family regulator
MTQQPVPDALRRLVLRVTNRRRLYEAIIAAPGTHGRRLARELGMARGVVAHHLAQLEKHGFVFSHQAGRRRTLYACGQIEAEDVALIHVLRKPEQAALLHALLAHDGCGVTHLARHVGSPTSNVSYHLRRLRDVGVVEYYKIGRESIYVVRSPRRVGRWLAALQPQHARPVPDHALAGVLARAGSHRTASVAPGTSRPDVRATEPAGPASAPVGRRVHAKLQAPDETRV